MNVQVLSKFSEYLIFSLLEIAEMGSDFIIVNHRCTNYWDITSIDTRGHHSLLNLFIYKISILYDNFGPP